MFTPEVTYVPLNDFNRESYVMASKVENYKALYHAFLTKNPLLASEIEVGLKWMSYIAAGRFSQSPVLTELIHSAAKLLTLFNDNILRKAANIPVHNNVIVEKLQNFLAVIEYSEVFTEVAALRVFGEKGKWIIIVILQIFKTFIRLALLLKYKIGVLHSPPFPTLNRKVDVPQLCEKEIDKLDEDCKNDEVTFTLKRSGRVVRTLDSAPPLVSRSWKLPGNSVHLYHANPTELSNSQLAGEMLHICRPIAHLLAMGRYGEFSWKPWVISLGIDSASLHLMKSGKFNKVEKMELSRRALSLIVYLLRSPFYDQYSKTLILSSLKNIADTLPGSGILLRPILEYIPEWQKIYSYTWAS